MALPKIENVETKMSVPQEGLGSTVVEATQKKVQVAPVVSVATQTCLYTQLLIDRVR